MRERRREVDVRFFLSLALCCFSLRLLVVRCCILHCTLFESMDGYMGDGAYMDWMGRFFHCGGLPCIYECLVRCAFSSCSKEIRSEIDREGGDERSGS